MVNHFFILLSLFFSEIGIQHLLEDATRCYLVEEVHAGLEFKYIDVTAHDGVYAELVLVDEQSLTHLAQSCTQHRVLPIGACLVDAVQTIELGVVAMSQSLLLGEDVPYPMTCLASVPYFV